RLAASLAARPGVDDVPRPDDRPPRRAAVALVLRLGEGDRPELLFVKRAEFAGDPWSGQIAFPGGRHEPGDASLWHTAMRETWEETGLDLDRDARLLGRLDELHPRQPVLPAVVVRPYVAVAAPSGPFALSIEMAAAFWVPIERFAAEGVHAESEVRVRGTSLRVPSFVHEGHTIWGMTYRILEDFLARLAS
ncbi:MAG: CoA pyrophosphatase, partial [Gemmatirosa sp.]|nr:CoA pyrophosphatase [Gemmatirosa sp.]